MKEGGITPRAVAHFPGAWEARIKSVFDGFGLHALVVHREFPKADSGKSFVPSSTSKDILFLLCGDYSIVKDSKGPSINYLCPLKIGDF